MMSDIRFLARIAVAMTLCGSSSCAGVEEGAKQIRTSADLHAISRRVSALDTPLEEQTLIQVAASQNGGYDGWGRAILIFWEPCGLQSYLLISRGSDGKLDLESASDYCSEQPENVLGTPERDIVFLNGNPLKSATK